MAVRLEKGTALSCSSGLMVLSREPVLFKGGVSLCAQTSLIEMPAEQYVINDEVAAEVDADGRVLKKARRERALVGIARRSVAEALYDAMLFPHEADQLVRRMKMADPFLVNVGGTPLAYQSHVRSELLPDGLDPTHMYLWANAKIRSRRQDRRGRTQWTVDYRGRYWQTDDCD